MVQYTKQFQDYWALTAKQLSLDDDTSQNFYALLYGAYSEVQRHYHSIQHIVECYDNVAALHYRRHTATHRNFEWYPHPNSIALR